MEHVAIGDANFEEDPLVLFKAVDGIRVWAASEPMVLGAGRYSNGCGAIVLRDAHGQDYDKVTVNLVEDSEYNVPGSAGLMPAGFFVRLADAKRIDLVDGTEVAPHHESLVDLGIFEVCSIVRDSGFVKLYAVGWRFKECLVAKTYRVLCKGCRAEWDKDFENHATRALARDTVARLKNAKIDSSELDAYLRANPSE